VRALRGETHGVGARRARQVVHGECGRCFRSVDFTCQPDTPQSYRLIKRPSTRSCIRSVLEKHSVRRTSRLIRVRRLLCLLSIFCVCSLAHLRLLRIKMPLVGPPAVGERARDAKRLPQRCERQKGFAQFQAVCRRAKLLYMGTSRHRRYEPIGTRWALKWRGDGQLLGQCVRATKCDTLSDPLYATSGCAFLAPTRLQARGRMVKERGHEQLGV
jgi:hypothetical protein